jgi:hypothetical protein
MRKLMSIVYGVLKHQKTFTAEGLATA